MPMLARNSKATQSMVSGIVSLALLFCLGVLSIIPGIAAIVLGRQAKGEIAAANGTQSGDGQATAGLIMGITGTVVSVIMIIVLVFYFVTEGV